MVSNHIDWEHVIITCVLCLIAALVVLGTFTIAGNL